MGYQCSLSESQKNLLGRRKNTLQDGEPLCFVPREALRHPSLKLQPGTPAERSWPPLTRQGMVRELTERLLPEGRELSALSVSGMSFSAQQYIIIVKTGKIPGEAWG